MSGVKYLKGRCQHCGGHLEFAADHIGLAVDCPHCGQSTELMLEAPEVESAVPRRWVIMAVLAIVVLVGGLVTCILLLNHYEKQLARRKEKAAAAVNPAPGAPEASSAPATPAGTNGFQVSEVSLETTPGSSLVYAVGTLKNTTTRQRFGVRIEFDLLDAAGQKVGSAKDYHQVLEPAGDWRFKALVVEKKAVAVRVASIQEDQ